MSLGGSSTPISNAANASNAGAGSHINLSTPAGWAMLYFALSVVILSILFFSV